MATDSVIVVCEHDSEPLLRNLKHLLSKSTRYCSRYQLEPLVCCQWWLVLLRDSQALLGAADDMGRNLMSMLLLCMIEIPLRKLRLRL